MDQISWGDAEWNRIRQTVHDEALRTRIAASFLPLYGPLPGETVSVPLNSLSAGFSPNGPTKQFLEVDDYTTKRLASVSVNVRLKNHMLADPELASATMLFRRAASIVARVEDAIIFNGKSESSLELPGVPDVYTIGGDTSYTGLLQAAGHKIAVAAPPEASSQGPSVYDAIVEAVLALEGSGCHRPFAVVLGHDLFRDLHTPMPGSMVLPRDAVLPFTEGPLLRSSSIPPNKGLVMSLQGDPVEIVVPSDISVRYLQADLDGGHVFRVSQRFLLRIKDHFAVARIKR